MYFTLVSNLFCKSTFEKQLSEINYLNLADDISNDEYDNDK